MVNVTKVPTESVPLSFGDRNDQKRRVTHHSTGTLHRWLLHQGFTKPVGTGPVVTGQSGPARFRFRPVLNRTKFKIQKMKNFKKFLKILQGATNLMVPDFLKNSFV